MLNVCFLYNSMQQIYIEAAADDIVVEYIVYMGYMIILWLLRFEGERNDESKHALI